MYLYSLPLDVSRDDMKEGEAKSLRHVKLRNNKHEREREIMNYKRTLRITQIREREINYTNMLL